MFGFFIKKAFFDGWDNLIGVAGQNVIYILLFTGFIGSISLLESMTALAIVFMILVALVYFIILGGTAAASYGYSNYEKETFEPFAKGIRRNIRHSLLFGLVSIFIAGVLLFVMPFYISMGNMVGLIIGLVLFWISVMFMCALPYYFPLMCLLPGDRPLKTLKKCFIIFSDNMRFSLLFTLYNIILIALTIVTMGFIPGVAGFSLAGQDAMKLLMFKYDYLEENPDADRKHIPWEELIYDEREKIGPRSFKSMIFPWKY